MNPSACSTPSGSECPLRANSGITRQASIVTAQQANTMKKLDQSMGSLTAAPYGRRPRAR